MKKKTKKFLTNPFFINIGIALLILIIFFIGAFLWLDSYTNHGERIIVPDLQGLNEKAAAKLLEDKELKYEIIDSVFVKNKQHGTVKEQNPEAGSGVKKERTIYLTIYSHSPRKIVLPDLRDVSLRQAEAIISTSGLKVGSYEYVPSEYKNLVQDVKYGNMIVAPGTRITEGASVVLVVGRGLSNEMVTVVSLRGLTLERAVERARSSSLNIGNVYYDVEPASEKEKAQYFVYKQDPITNSQVFSGQAVKIFLTKNKSLLNKAEEIAENDDYTVDL